MHTVILAIHILLAIAITIFVLAQRSEGGALGSLGGGSGANSFLTGRQAGNFLSRTTGFLFAGFIITSLSLVIMAKQANTATPASIMPTQQKQAQ